MTYWKDVDKGKFNCIRHHMIQCSFESIPTEDCDLIGTSVNSILYGAASQKAIAIESNINEFTNEFTKANWMGHEWIEQDI